MRAPADTIFALSSAPGRAGIAVLRLSGPAARTVLTRMAGLAVPPRPREARLVPLRSPDTGALIDRGLVLWFPGPNSFTGEDVAEFHVHGGPTIVAALVDGFGAFDGCRPAEPGEFTRRAFEHGKLDLTAAEGLADLINAETEAQRRLALRQFEGELGALYEGWRTRLVRVLAHLEATIDFADEDLPDGLCENAASAIGELIEEVKAHLADNHRGERLREGVYVAILGAPNVGKSSLLNTLSKREAAIVSEVAGTTRDVIEVHLDLGGFPVTVADTAGLRTVADQIEAEGVRRALARAERADLKLVVVDAAIWPAIDPASAAVIDAASVVVVNKIDLTPVEGDPARPTTVPVSVKTGAGIERLMDLVAESVRARFDVGRDPVLTRARHRAALEQARDALGRALQGKELELVAEDTRMAARALGRIVGGVDVEDILDVVFREFCIGK